MMDINSKRTAHVRLTKKVRGISQDWPPHGATELPRCTRGGHGSWLWGGQSWPGSPLGTAFSRLDGAPQALHKLLRQPVQRQERNALLRFRLGERRVVIPEGRFHLGLATLRNLEEKCFGALRSEE